MRFNEIGVAFDEARDHAQPTDAIALFHPEGTLSSNEQRKAIHGELTGHIKIMARTPHIFPRDEVARLRRFRSLVQSMPVGSNIFQHRSDCA